MTAVSALDWKPSPHARRTHSRGVLRRLPRSERIAMREERNPALKVARIAKAEAHREQRHATREARRAAFLAARGGA